MKYLLQIYDRGATEQVARLAAEEQQAIVGEYLAIGQSPGVIGGEQLRPVETATTVRVQGGQTLLSDGPFVEAKEHLGGYFLVDAEDLDAALEIAARIPAARMGGVIEVRPVVER
ncbi:MAG TPA: YciI family protein [Solirubrobacteraceae bacterium]|nr:YciI family protein [Solirubrobacteraceae bacterium]